MEGLLATIIDAWHRRTVLAKLFSYASIGLVNVIVDVATFTVRLSWSDCRWFHRIWSPGSSRLLAPMR